MEILRLRLDQIEVPANRQRSEVDGERLGELMESIQAHGLLQPVVVRGGSAEGTYTLVAGGRRLAALSNIAGLGGTVAFGGRPMDQGLVPCVSLTALDPLAAEEAELEENIRRVDLSFQDRARATHRIAELRRKQAEREGSLPPPLSALAAEVRGASQDAIERTRREIILAPLLDKPQFQGVKTLDEAWKAHLREEDKERNTALAAKVGLTFGRHSHVLIQGDCLEWIRACPAEQFDVIITDPPYGIGADGFGDAGGRLVSQTHSYEDSPDAWRDIIGSVGSHWGRVAKEQAHLYLCCDIDGFHYARDWLTTKGWWVHRTPLINYKVDGSRVPWPQNGPQRKWEMILYAVKGRKPVSRIYPDVIETRGDENLGHGAQKPVALYRNLLERSVKPGDSVLDCFGGTGTAILACHELKCKCTYIEKDPGYYGIAVKRTGELK